MDVLIHSEGFTLDSRKKALIGEKVGRLEHYAPHALRARVTLRLDSAHHNDQQFAAHILVEIPGNDVAAKEKAGEPLEAIDLLVEKMERQLQRRKTVKHRTRAASRGLRGMAGMPHTREE
jgi:ribosomal subunit interface protein